MMALATTLISSPFLRSSFSRADWDSSAFEVSSSGRLARAEGPVRVRCVVQSGSQKSSRESDLSTSRVRCVVQTGSQRSSRESDLSTSLFSPLSSTSVEWWRRQSRCQSPWSSIDSRVHGAANNSSDRISEPTIADWQLDEPTWTQHPLEETFTNRGTSGGVPVFVMLPLDSVNLLSNTVNKKRAMNASLLALKSAGVEGIMMDVWWGIVEKDGPRRYNWSAYRELIQMARKHGLKVQAVMSFHQCGGNVGDSCNIPLPRWVIEEVGSNNDLVYTDKYGNRNYEYLSLSVDELPVLKGRTPVLVYADFMRSFRDAFSDLLGETIIEIQVGMGPAGELRYPAYPEQNGRWRFPGIGEFQCYDKYVLASLKVAAEASGQPGWGHGGPSDAGNYNQWPEETGFFRKDGGWNTEYGKFFLGWYSEMLLGHGERVLSAAEGVFRGTGVVLSGKVAGIHWHYRTKSHAAELTAGYYNSQGRDGYWPIARMFGRHGVTLNFTCIEMRDEEQPGEAQCSPESLLRQVTTAARKSGLRLAGENALPRFDQIAHDQIVRKSRLRFDEHGELSEEQEPMCAFTFLRMSESLFYSENWRLFVLFVRHMQEGHTVQPRGQEHTETDPNGSGPLLHEASMTVNHH